MESKKIAVPTVSMKKIRSQKKKDNQYQISTIALLALENAIWKFMLNKDKLVKTLIGTDEQANIYCKDNTD